MKVLILTEGGSRRGFGHVSRCLALYEAFEEKGVIPKLIINGQRDVEYLLKGKKYEIFNWIKEKRILLESVKNADMVIMDSYMAGISFYRRISVLARVPVYIDDNNRLDYPDGIVVNGSIYGGGIDYPKKNNTRYLLGPRYALLRKAFWRVPRKTINEKLDRVMVTFGGSDVANMTPRVLKFLNKKYPQVGKDVVIGRGFGNIEEIKRLKDKRTDLIYCPTSAALRRSMLRSDMAVSAGGQTLYELARVGVPSVAVIVSDNQINNVRGWQTRCGVYNAGRFGKDGVLKNLEVFIDKMKDKGVRAAMSQRMRNLINGGGANMVADHLLRAYEIR